MALKDNIKRIRELKGLSIPDLAAKMEIDKAGIYKWEDGSVIPGGKSLTAIAEALGVTVNDLLSENLTHEQNESSIEGKPVFEVNKVYKDLVEGNSDYSLIPKTVLQGEYRLVLDKDISWRNFMVQSIMDGKNETIRELKDRIEKAEKRIDELTQRPIPKKDGK